MWIKTTGGKLVNVQHFDGIVTEARPALPGRRDAQMAGMTAEEYAKREAREAELEEAGKATQIVAYLGDRRVVLGDELSDEEAERGMSMLALVAGAQSLAEYVQPAPPSKYEL